MKDRVKPLFFASLFAAALLLVSCGGSRLWTDVDSEEELRLLLDSDSRYTAVLADRAAPETLDRLMDKPENVSTDDERPVPSAADETPAPTDGETGVVPPLLLIEETDGVEGPSPDRSLSEEPRDQESGKGGEEASETASPEPAAAPEKAAPASEAYYVLNTSSKKFHRPDCTSVGTIKPKNYAEALDRDAILKDGYSPCKRCEP